jgi:hypothetical protein
MHDVDKIRSYMSHALLEREDSHTDQIYEQQGPSGNDEDGTPTVKKFSGFCHSTVHCPEQSAIWSVI